MLYESLGDLPRPWEWLRLTGGCSQAFLPSNPSDPSEVPFGRYEHTALQLQRIFPDTPRAGTAPLTPNLGRKCAQERLAGGIFGKTSKQPSPIRDSTEVVKMKRIP